MQKNLKKKIIKKQKKINEWLLRKTLNRLQGSKIKANIFYFQIIHIIAVLNFSTKFTRILSRQKNKSEKCYIYNESTELSLLVKSTVKSTVSPSTWQ